jgi:hypothetical protein
MGTQSFGDVSPLIKNHHSIEKYFLVFTKPIHFIISKFANLLIQFQPCLATMPSLARQGHEFPARNGPPYPPAKSLRSGFTISKFANLLIQFQPCLATLRSLARQGQEVPARTLEDPS